MNVFNTLYDSILIEATYYMLHKHVLAQVRVMCVEVCCTIEHKYM